MNYSVDPKYSMLLFFIFPAIGCAQMVNTGTLYIEPKTIVATFENFNNKSDGDFINDGDLFIYNNYNNDGLATFSPEVKSGTTNMYGKFGSQIISGSSNIEWNNVVFDNESKDPVFYLQNSVSINGEAFFINGIVENDSKTRSLLFEPNATHNYSSDKSFVDGFVEKKGNNTDFAFPIGNKKNYSYCRISNGKLNTNEYIARFYFENSNLLFPHSNKATNIAVIDENQYWSVVKSISSEDVFLALNMNLNTTSPIILTSPIEEIHIIGWDPIQKIWLDLGGVFNVSDSEITTDNEALKICNVFTFGKVRGEFSNNNDVVAYQAISPNNDGLNDFFYIKNIENFPNNSVEIYNRWGIKVYEKQGYDNNPTTSFKGISQARATISKAEGLPEGVYFYVVTYLDKDLAKKEIKSYLYIKR